MACTIVNGLPNPPLGVAILSDSKSALQALAAGGTRNRGDLQAEILFLAHQLILKGSDVFLMWLPSHTGIRGNEFADKEAKEAANDGTAVDLKLSLTEMKSATHRMKHKLGVQDFLQLHPDLGELHVQVLTRSLLTSEIGQWF